MMAQGFASLVTVSRKGLQRRRRLNKLRWVSVFLLGAVVCLILIYCFLRMGYKLQIDYNEGWNVFHGIEAVSGQPLYDGKRFLTPVNYPPLSFYIIGAIGEITGNPLLSGRLVSFLSLILIAIFTGLVVRSLGGDGYESIFSGVLCLGFFCTFAQVYVGLDDPQLLGQSIMMGGLLLYLSHQGGKDGENVKRDLWIAFLFSFGMFVKHNLIPIPVAVSIGILFQSRRRFFRLVAASSAFVVLFSIVSYLLFGSSFFAQLFTSRVYSAEKPAYFLYHHFGMNMLIPILLVIPWIVRFLKEDRKRVIAVYLLLSLALGVYTLGGAGTDVNMLFDLYISTAISIGLVLSVLGADTKGENITGPVFLEISYLMIPFLVASGIFWKAPNTIPRHPRSFLMDQENLFLEEAAFLSSRSGPILCESTLLCYFAKKPFIYDPFLVGEMVATDKIKEEVILKLFKNKYFAIIQIDRQLPETYTEGASFSITKKEKVDDRFTKNMYIALANNYTLVRKIGSYYNYCPKAMVDEMHGSH